MHEPSNSFSVFDNQEEIEKLKNLSKADLLKQKPSELNYVVRKYGLSYSDFNIHPSDVLTVLETCKDDNLLITLGYMIEKSENEIKYNLVSEIKNRIEKCSDGAKLFLENQIEKHLDRKKSQISKTGLKKAGVERRQKKRIYVQKTIQNVKTKKRRQEEENFKMFNFKKTTRNKIIVTKATEPGQYVNDLEGSDASVLKTTWTNCLELYQKAKRGDDLKGKDKDEFLPKHFLESNFIWAVKRKIMKSFFVHRMIASTLSKISIRQKLEKTIIDKLMLCVASDDELLKLLGLDKKEDLHCKKIIAA